MRNTRIGWGKLKLVLAFGVLASLYAGPARAQDEGNPPGRAARLSFVQGNVSFQPSGETQWSQAILNYTMTTGDRIYTDQGAGAEIEVGPSTVRLSEATDLTMANLNDQIMQLGIGQGTVRLSVYEIQPGNTVEIDTPNGALTALGPGFYRVDVEPNSGTRVTVDRGGLQVTGGGANVRVEPEQAVELTGTGPIQVNSVEFPGPDGFDQWCASRDQRVASLQSRQYVNPYIPGAEDLDAYGQWSTAPDYGPVWYPAGVQAGWVPYRYGHWAWVEPWGWTWVEDEPWGFCPFHYGRWALVGARWGWVPGPVAVLPVYSPALVAFVGGGGFSVGLGFGGGGVAAWFPLGPRDPFIPWYHYQGNYLRQVNITNVRNVTYISSVTNVTSVNMTSIHYQYRTVAATAVPANVFQGGQPVARNSVRVSPQQLASAQVISHPAVAPVQSAVFGGRTPVAAPALRTARVTGPPRAPVMDSPARGLPEASKPAPRSMPTARNVPGGPPASRPTFITRNPAPPLDVPFAAHEQALKQNAGRPLDPEQEKNVRQGRPAGPAPYRATPKPEKKEAPRSNSRQRQ